MADNSINVFTVPAGNDTQVVALNVSAGGGAFYVSIILSPDEAEAVAKVLLDSARKAMTKIILPDGPVIATS